MGVKIGETFFKWTVVDDAGHKNGLQYVLCRCECGNEKIVYYGNLKSGKSKSCGRCKTSYVKVGDVFGRWTVIKVHDKCDSNHKRRATCQCSCGTEKDIVIDKLVRGLSTGCGHWKSNAKAHPRLYTVYMDMKARCYNKNEKAYPNYGGRGIKMCPEWLGENGFDRFVEWAIKTKYDETAEGHKCTIDRIDTNGNYEPSNCKWSDAREQARNRRSTIMVEYKGEIHCLTEWAEILGVKFATLRDRYKKGERGDVLFDVNSHITGNRL